MKDARYKQNKKQSFMTVFFGIKKERKLYKKLQGSRLFWSLRAVCTVLTFCGGL